MEQSPSKSDSHSASQEIAYLLRNPKAHYSVHKTPPLIPILSQMRPFHTFSLYFLNVHSNIILPSTPSSYEWSHPIRLKVKAKVVPVL